MWSLSILAIKLSKLGWLLDMVSNGFGGVMF